MGSTGDANATRRCTARGVGLVLLLALTASIGAPSLVGAQQCRPLDGDRFRYPHRDVVSRTVVGSFAIPAGIGGWDARDWGMFAGFAGATIATMAPSGRSLDVRFQGWVNAHHGRGADRFFRPLGTIPMAAGFVGYTAILAATAWAFDLPELREYTSLMVEAVGITQFYHVTAKLLLGREGPYQGNGNGTFHGPTQMFFPGGTPSGHTATVYAVLATAAEFYDSWALRLITHLAGIYTAATLIYHRQHFLSDTIWGAGMGYAVARWVVRHHSSRYRCGAPVEPDTFVAPWAAHRGGGLMVSVFF